MATEPMIVHVPEGSELARMLDDAGDMPLRLVRRGVTYRVSREDDDPWAGYDPEAVRKSLRRFAGMLTPEEGVELKDYVYRGREEGNRPVDRP
jgi:hypothetical protein